MGFYGFAFERTCNGRQQRMQRSLPLLPGKASSSTWDAWPACQVRERNIGRSVRLISKTNLLATAGPGQKGRLFFIYSIAERKRTMTAKPADKTRRNSILMVLLLGFVIREVVVRALGHTDADGNF
jgi:hypothetical protein